MKTQFTKGTWIAENVNGEHKNIVIYTLEKSEGILNIYPGTEAEANAKLIAAAPEMLETLLVIKKHIEQTQTDFQFNDVIIPKTDLIRYIEMAICKATE